MERLLVERNVNLSTFTEIHAFEDLFEMNFHHTFFLRTQIGNEIRQRIEELAASL